MPPPPSLTPAQLALQAERKALKEAKKAAAQAEAKAKGVATPELLSDSDKAKFLKRDWIARGEQSTKPLRIVTWNILAQTLVRRELFPGSDALRWSDRKPMLMAELANYSTADVICLQECDRLSDLARALPTHTPVDTKGRGKLHGLVVMYRSDRFKVKASQTVYLDEEKLSEKDGQEGRGGSRQTKNVGLIVGLEDSNGQGILVATTHLFWHPKQVATVSSSRWKLIDRFAYERIRQSILLIRAIRRFQKEHGCEHWPAVLAGDLNTQPSEATYQLLSSPFTPLHPKVVEEVNASRLIHISVEAIGQSIPGGGEDESDAAGQTEPEKDDEGELPDHDERSIAKTRPPREGDGMLEVEELVKLMQEILPSGATSTLASSSADQVPAGGSAGNTPSGTDTFGTRGGLEGMSGVGKDEPAYTCYTPLFKLTLDYIFLLPAISGPQLKVVEHLRAPLISELGAGLPRKGICASDHLAMGCGLA